MTDDAISRQVAIDAINGLPKWPDAVSEICLDYADVIAVLSELLPSAQQWTPCSEELPKAGVRYQVTFENGEVGYADFRNKIFLSDGSVKENVWETDPYYKDDGEVIAWMPLPKPYREERGGE